MTGKILVLTAIDDELDTERAPEGVEVIYSGVGKVNAASAATLSLGVLRPSLVINYGTAGKINEQLRGLVEVAHVVQRDMMAMPLAPRGRTPFSSDLDRLSSGHGDVICGTGCQTALNRDPDRRAKGTPFGGEERQRSPPAELVRVAQPGRARWRGRGL